jgi:hypothetical protein
MKEIGVHAMIRANFAHHFSKPPPSSTFQAHSPPTSPCEMHTTHQLTSVTFARLKGRDGTIQTHGFCLYHAVTFTVRYVPIPVTGTVLPGMGVILNFLTCGIPVPSLNGAFQTSDQAIGPVPTSSRICDRTSVRFT